MTVKWYVQCSRGCSDVLKTFISRKRNFRHMEVIWGVIIDVVCSNVVLRCV